MQIEKDGRVSGLTAGFGDYYATLKPVAKKMAEVWGCSEELADAIVNLQVMAKTNQQRVFKCATDEEMAAEMNEVAKVFAAFTDRMLNAKK